MQHKIEVLECMKGSFTESVIYEADGIEFTVSGEFFVDSKEKRHHTHIFADGVEMDVIF